ncbi:MAG: type VI secretion system protein TssA [Candidatus Eisenbacteria bacterium]
MDQKELEALGSRPVRDDAPSGDPIRDQPEFEALQLQIRKLELPAGEQPDWAMVVESAAGLVRDRSKDLLVLSWLAVALAERQGPAGLRTGLAIVRDAVTGFWDTLYPEPRRVRARVAAMEWLSARATRTVGRFDLDSAAVPALEESLSLVEALDVFFREKVEEGWGGMGDLRSVLNEWRGRLSSPSTIGPTPATGSAAPAGPSAAVGGAMALPAEAPSTPADIQRFLEQLRQGAYRLAQSLREANPKDPLAYRLPRALAWMHLAQLPPNTGGKTEIQPPGDTTALQEAARQSQWPALLEQTEGRLRASILWLDPHRYACQALEAIGAPDAAAAVTIELAGLLRRLPGLDQLRFADGAPLADPQTKAWIREHVLAQEGGPEARTAAPAAPAQAADETEGWDETVEKAHALARRKQLADAIRLLEERAAGCRRLRARAAWRLEIGKLCLQNGRASTAYAHLSALDAELRAAGPDAWDFDFGLDLAKNLFLSHQAALSSARSPAGEELTVSQELWGRLCRIDPSAAAMLEGKP